MEEKVQPIPRIQNLVVARYMDGRIAKGTTYDFGPQKNKFHVISIGADGKEVIYEISLSELKAVFFVKSLEGRQGPPSLKGLLEEETGSGGSRKLKVTFLDGETLTGETQGYTPERTGFFVIPSEKDSNNLRIFVISSAVKQVETWR